MEKSLTYSEPVQIPTEELSSSQVLGIHGSNGASAFILPAAIIF